MCFSLGAGKKLYIIGTRHMLIINIHRMFINETNPNSIIIEEFVKTNVPKPKAVVALVKKVAFPTFCIILSKAESLSP